MRSKFCMEFSEKVSLRWKEKKSSIFSHIINIFSPFVTTDILISNFFALLMNAIFLLFYRRHTLQLPGMWSFWDNREKNLKNLSYKHNKAKQIILSTSNKWMNLLRFLIFWGSSKNWSLSEKASSYCQVG